MNRKNTRLFNGPGFDGRLGPFDAYKLIGKRFASSKTRTTAPGQPLPSARSLHGGQGGECQLLTVTSELGRGAGRYVKLFGQLKPKENEWRVQKRISGN